MEENEEFDSDFHSEDIPISEEFWNYMEHYWHNNREFPESTEATLNKKADLVDGKVPSSQLPSYVDDVLEFDSFENLPSSGEKGKIYLITNNNTQFRWSGSEYIQLNSDEYFMTTNTYQDITGRKDFHNNSGNSGYAEHKLWVVGSNGSKAGIPFYSDGLGVGQINFDGTFNLKDASDTIYKPIKALSFVKDDSNDEQFLMGGGAELSKFSKEDSFVHSGRDFTNGTLIKTNIDYSQSEGAPFLLEMKGNMYYGGMVLDCKVQGYIYNNSIINANGYSTHADLTSIIALNLGGNLCFWFPRLSYWQGFSVKATTTTGGQLGSVNRVYSIDNSADPGGTKRVTIPIQTLATTEWANNNFLAQRGGYHTGTIAKTNFPLSITDYTGDPSTTHFQSYYGTSFHFQGPNTWYNRLDFPVYAEKLFLYQGINTTDMTLRGYIPILNDNVINWDSTNFNPSDYVTINTPQTIIADKIYEPTSAVSFKGHDLNHVNVFRHTIGDTGVVSGHEYTHYNTRWKVGNKRGGSDNTLGYAFESSTNDGATYDEKVLIQPDGNIKTSSFGSASDWNAKVSQSQLGNYLPLSGGTLTGNGQIRSNGNIIPRQENSTNATGFFWETMANDAILAGIGTLTQGDFVQHSYIGWGSYPWDSATSLAVSENYLTYKNQNIWHTGNLSQSYVDYLSYLASVGAATLGYVNGNFLSLSGGTMTGDIKTYSFDSGTDSFGTYFEAKNDIGIRIQYLKNNGNYSQLLVQDTLKFNNNVIWDEGNFNPNTKVNALENAKAIGFSSGNYPTQNGVEYPYMYFDNGSATGYVALATQDFVNSNFATYSELTNYATLDTYQKITGDKIFTGFVKVPPAYDGDEAVPYNQLLEALDWYTVRNHDGLAKYLGFTGANIANAPYIRTSTDEVITLATEKWSSNNFVSLSRDQNIDGHKRFTNPVRLPEAINPDEAVNLGQALELTEDRTNSRFLTRTTSGSSTYDLVGYGRPKMTNIICKGNGGFSLDIDGFEKGMTVKISNTTGQTIDVNFNNGSVSTAVDIKNWTEFHMDSEGDIIRTDANQATII
ncbi:hypothetical protein [Chryseobacterium sp. 18068]|uniref:hypothetical protein n=1 Tax=Chryseobacterium sp. 18068 TaxID=2681414 RepID=UPI00135C9039|nr:hypothetical protein [Chryseobacterium sp. 18068]